MEKMAKEKLINAITGCFDSQKPLEDIHRILESLLQAGYEKARMIADLEEYRMGLQSEGKQREEDLVLDGLDFLTGWVGPEKQL
jgi:hypothetical protein